MTAISGIINQSDSKAKTTAMLDTMKHRGPDLRNLSETQTSCLGAIASDLSDMRGSGFAEQGEITVLFDGEIYNERNENESDANLVLRLYRSFGRTFPAHLEGVFACAVMHGDELILARDSFGVRPLYFGNTAESGFCFASEMKALVGLSENVEEALPGTTLSSAHGVAGYIPKTPSVTVPDTPRDAADMLRTLLLKSVEKRLADGAVGVCLLSGGLDSSIIAAAAKKLGADIPLLTVGFEKNAPDVENAKIVAEHLNMKHEIRIFNAEEIEKIVPKAVWSMESFDEDCVSGTISNLFASELAATFTSCILSGEGADELFGGYHLIKAIPSGNGRLKIMQRLLAISYNTALQRLDRSMTANTINYRTPFLDTQVAAFAMHLPVDWKIRRAENGDLIEKWILREAFKDFLPESIYKRIKLRFSGGTGTDSVMDNIAESHVSTQDFKAQPKTTPEGYILNSPKELWYYRLFKEQFPAPCFEQLVGRWDPNK